jgi:hypothetical protein
MDTLNVDPTSIKSNTSKLDNFDFTVYPNPSNGLFTLQSVGNTTNLEDILIYDLQGRLLSRRKNINLINNRIILDLRSFQLAKGTYYLKLKHNDNHQLVPIVID